MYEKLVNRLRAVAGGGREEKCDGCPYEEDYPCCVDCLDKLHKQAAAAFEDLEGKYFLMKKTAEWLSEKVHRWIPVTERLPEKDGTFITAYSRGGVSQNWYMTFHHGGGKWYQNSEDTGEVTHWMPLPKPPKEET